MITQAGPRCDVCGDYILLDTSINPFSLRGTEGECHAHDKCVPLLKEMAEKKDYTVLPDGPLRKWLHEHREQIDD